MGRQTTIIPKAPVARILIEAGAKRVSNEAVEEFSSVIYSMAEKIAKRAVDVSKHSGRKTINEADIKLAAKN